MGECGCTIGNKLYRLKAPNGYYVLQMNPGCDYCDAAPSIHILDSKTAKLYLEDELKHVEDLPMTGCGNEAVAVIVCGTTRDEARFVAVETMVGAETENGRVDEIVAEMLGEDLWEHSLNKSPHVIGPRA